MRRVRASAIPRPRRSASSTKKQNDHGGSRAKERLQEPHRGERAVERLAARDQRALRVALAGAALAAGPRVTAGCSRLKSARPARVVRPGWAPIGVSPSASGGSDGLLGGSA